MKGFLEYVDGSSIIHKLNPVTKILLSLCICVAAFISDILLFLVGLILIDLLVGLIGGVFDRALGMLKGLVKFSIFLFVLQLFFVNTGSILLSLPLGIKITTGGVIFAAKVVLRLIAAPIPLALLLSVTRINDLSNSLMKCLRIPYKYVFAFTTSIRFIPIFAEEMKAIIEAQTARGIEFDTKNAFKKFKLILPLCFPLLISSVRKINSSAIAAEVRGFNLRTHKSGYKTYSFGANDFFTLLFCAGLICASIII